MKTTFGDSNAIDDVFIQLMYTLPQNLVVVASTELTKLKQLKYEGVFKLKCPHTLKIEISHVCA